MLATAGKPPLRFPAMKGMPPLNEQMDAIRRGAVEILPEDHLVRKLERAIATATPLIVKQGFDPTRPDLHLGHMVSVRKLRTFQELGHTVVFLIGDFTALVGDPSGRSETRARMSEEEVARNAATYRDQIFRILDPKHTVIDRNSRWLGALAMTDIVELTSHYTVARMLERDDFAARWKAQAPISVMEFLYPLLVAYDSVYLKADVELGGTDQKFNLLTGRTLMERYGLEPQVAMTMPILRGLDGERKMSKSYDNYIGITESPEDIYGKTMSIPDALLEEWYTLVSSLPATDLPAALARCAREPYAAKRALSADLATQFHGAEAALKAAAHFDRLFKSKEAPAERPAKAHAPGKLATVLKDIGFAKSVSEARRMIEQGGVQLDGARLDDPDTELFAGSYLLKYGKLKFADLTIRA
jgi:tyrosyl-tRNA synthetase